MIKFGKSAIMEWSDSDKSGLISSKSTIEWSALAYSTESTVEWSALSLEERQQIYILTEVSTVKSLKRLGSFVNFQRENIFIISVEMQKSDFVPVNWQRNLWCTAQV